VTLLAISAIGADRPGIVAAVTRVLYERGGNIEDSSMTILRGHFAMTLIVAGGDSAADLESALASVATELGLVLAVREVAPEAAHAPARPYVVTVYGADHPGIVSAVAGLLAGLGVNVTDLSTRLVDQPDPLYAMFLDVDLPPGADVAEVERALRALAADLAVEASIHAADADVL
jgi:glycine cleavage system transcriptional repressor